jgi:hypothetical protein
MICRLLSALALYAAAAAFVCPAQAQDTPATVGSQLPVFTFKGLVAGSPVPKGPLQVCRSWEIDRRLNICFFKDDNVAGIYPRRVDALMYNGSFAGVLYHTDHANYSRILDALTAKYGQSCSTEQEKWQNKIGGTFDNIVTKWCFKTGTLMLKSIGSDIEHTEFSYIDNVTSPAHDKAVVNF